ncbi:MAG TPA: rhomboid family intramembrane serine protease [Puia sp.]|nr:rhomboid family intramembrane serine protease [Puia sp.]
MSFALTPNSSIDIGLDGLDPAQFLALCMDVANALEWNVYYISESGFIAYTSKKKLARKQEVTIRIADDIANIRSESTGNEIYDRGKNQKNLQQFYDLLADKRSTTPPEQLTQQFEALKPQIAPPERDILNKPPPTSQEKWRDFFSLFRPRPAFFITPILIDLNLAVFIVMVLSGVSLFLPGTHSLIQWGGNIRYLTLDHQWWRLITCCFVHIGILHLLLNMYALLYIGILLEPQLGRARFASAYLLTGIMASLASLYWHTHTLSAGASGAIFGMYGVFLALLTTNLIEKTRRTALLASIGVFVGYNLVLGAKAGVDNAAHIGGLLSGIIIGYLYYPGLKRQYPGTLKYSGIAMATLAVLVTSMVAFKKIPNGIGQYQDKMRSFERYQQRALAIFEHNESDTPADKWLIAIRDTGIYNWNEAIRVLTEAHRLDLSEPLKRRTDILIQYCNVRIASYNYYAEKFAGTAAPGADSVDIYNSQLNDLVATLKRIK